MPMLQARDGDTCTEDRPCRGADRCVRCQAQEALSADDWYLLAFYRRVRDQIINQTPMGDKEGKCIVTPRLEGYEAALRIHGYPRHEWSWLSDAAELIHRLVNGQERIEGRVALGRAPLEDLLGD